MISVAICLVSHGQPWKAHEDCMAALFRTYPEWPVFTAHGIPCLEIARGAVAEKAKLSANMLLWIDNDIVFPVGACGHVISEALERQSLVGCVYSGKPGGPRLNLLPGESLLYPNQVQEVADIGFGLCSFPSTLLDSMNVGDGWKGPGNTTIRPWFSNDSSWGEMRSDDYAFCRRARESGHKVFASTVYRIGHVGPHIYYPW